MADDIEHPAGKHEKRLERIQTWVDRAIRRGGLRPRYAAYLVIAVWLVAIISFGIFQRIAEPHTYPTIWLAWWWAIQTVTTVGYGDVVPRHTAGKAVAAFLMVGGLSFLSILTATITSSFVARRQDQARAQGEDPVMRELGRIAERLDALERELSRPRREGGPPRPPPTTAATPPSRPGDAADGRS